MFPVPSHRFTIAQCVRIVLAVGWSDFVLKYRGSMLGYFWSLLGPLVKFLVILHIIGPFVDISHYPLYLFLGIIIWEHFAVTSTSCMSMLYEKESLVKKLKFPRILLVFITGWTNMIIFFTHLLIFVVFAWWGDVRFAFVDLYVLVILLQMTLIALGTGMVLGSYSLKYRDVQHLWQIVTQVLFWLTPILYAYKPKMSLHEAFVNALGGLTHLSPGQWVDLFIYFQPLSILVHDARRVLLSDNLGDVPSLSHAIVFTAICMVGFLWAARLFTRRSKDFIQEY